LIAEFDWLSNCFLIEVENFGQFDDANVFMFEVWCYMNLEMK